MVLWIVSQIAGKERKKAKESVDGTNLLLNRVQATLTT